jgi:DNA mismatch endonuclease (patch repair protein)
MSQIRHRDTKPEMLVRRLVFAMGYRYRLHGKGLPGRPDMVFPGRRKVIFVHGCFWHRHSCANGRVAPATRAAFWRTKFQENVERDAQALRLLREMGWSALIIWECQTKNPDRLVNRVHQFLEKDSVESVPN